MGRTYFLQTFLKKFKIHHSQDESVCCHCFRLQELKRKERLSRLEKDELKKLEIHINKWHEQTQSYLIHKNKLVSEMQQNVLIVVQDFTQIKVQSTFFQDLIICFYYYNEEEQDKIGRIYHHFVAPKSNTKNDVLFVFGVWREMMRKGVLQGFNKIIIFSDGGPKHFKTTATINFFGYLKKCLQVDLEYHFFESNHGHSICDAVACHAKRALNNEQRNNQVPINKPLEICTVLNKIKNCEAEIATISTEEKDFVTFQGIRTCMKFCFAMNRVLGYSLSKDNIEKKTWALVTRPFIPFQTDFEE